MEGTRKALSCLGPGTIDLVEVESDIWVGNMIAQHDVGFKGNTPPIRYSALEKCLSAVAVEAKQLNASVRYIRVSTVEQGMTGVSLQEQKDAIGRYVERNRLHVAIWLEEMETAAKRARPIFMQAVRTLRRRNAKGIILHKLDRGARTLKDWAEIGELADRGLEIHFVSEGFDLQSRGGRLSADIQAVVAADYIHNLREETRKGFYGRLKEGLYPLRAPVGYLDKGKGKPKEIDPVMGPLVRKGFELYTSTVHNLETL